MISFRSFVNALRKLEIDNQQPVIVHTSLSAFGEVQGGVETFLGALLYSFKTVVMPSFTSRTMIIPESGPANNGIEYGSGTQSNLEAEFYQINMPVDKTLGEIPEGFRRHQSSQRTNHPILSFCGIEARGILNSQTILEPLEPIKTLMESDGWVVLMGVDHTSNTSIHLAEQLAGRKQFVRWAITPKEVVECPNIPGCSRGFNALAPRLDGDIRNVNLVSAEIQAILVADLVKTAQDWIAADPEALLCDDPECVSCTTIRRGGV